MSGNEHPIWHIWAIIASAICIAAFALITYEPDPSTGRYTMTDQVCSETGLELTFRNIDEENHTYRLGALGRASDGMVLQRDTAILFNVAPGVGRPVEFTWSDGAVSYCDVETVEVDP